MSRIGLVAVLEYDNVGCLLTQLVKLCKGCHRSIHMAVHAAVFAHAFAVILVTQREERLIVNSHGYLKVAVQIISIAIFAIPIFNGTLLHASSGGASDMLHILMGTKLAIEISGFIGFAYALEGEGGSVKANIFTLLAQVRIYAKVTGTRIVIFNAEIRRLRDMLVYILKRRFVRQNLSFIDREITAVGKIADRSAVRPDIGQKLRFIGTGGNDSVFVRNHFHSIAGTIGVGHVAHGVVFVACLADQQIPLAALIAAAGRIEARRESGLLFFMTAGCSMRKRLHKKIFGRHLFAQRFIGKIGLAIRAVPAFLDARGAAGGALSFYVGQRIDIMIALSLHVKEDAGVRLREGLDTITGNFRCSNTVMGINVGLNALKAGNAAIVTAVSRLGANLPVAVAAHAQLPPGRTGRAGADGHFGMVVMSGGTVITSGGKAKHITMSVNSKLVLIFRQIVRLKTQSEDTVFRFIFAVVVCVIMFVICVIIISRNGVLIITDRKCVADTVILVIFLAVG